MQKNAKKRQKNQAKRSAMPDFKNISKKQSETLKQIKYKIYF